MQLYAFDEIESIISAEHAVKQRDYICFECRGIVRLRSGAHRQKHFYHLKSENSCYLSGKSLTHIQVQMALYKLLPNCVLEQRFPEINRIADVVWIKEKIIFEVQCSSIKGEEVIERNKNYGSLGYEVVWILHDQRYNRWRVTAAESVLRNCPHYFTNMNEDGEGIIYDQFDIILNGMRHHKQSPLPINVSTPLRTHGLSWGFKLTRERFTNWAIRFDGDLTTLLVNDPYIVKAMEVEKSLTPKKEPQTWRSIVHKYLIRPYFILFQILLERACKK